MPLRDDDGAFKGIPDHWQQYLLCVLLHLTLPILPIFFEKLTGEPFKVTTLTLGASMYALSVGASSVSPLQFGVGILQGIIFATLFGVYSDPMDMAKGQNSFLLKSSAWVSMLFTFIIHGIERYNRHVIYKKQFFEFMHANPAKEGK